MAQPFDNELDPEVVVIQTDHGIEVHGPPRLSSMAEVQTLLARLEPETLADLLIAFNRSKDEAPGTPNGPDPSDLPPAG